LKNHPFFASIDFNTLNSQTPPPLVPISEQKTKILKSELNWFDFFVINLSHRKESLEKDEKELLAMIVYHKSHLMNHLKYLVITNKNRLILINFDSSDLREEMRFNETIEIQKRNTKEIMIKNPSDEQEWVLEDESGEGEKLYSKIYDILHPGLLNPKVE
jgi:hypothetical protein